jgi:hypothetical protein
MVWQTKYAHIALRRGDERRKREKGNVGMEEIFGF